jgi:FkbH-like protein
MNEDPAPPLVIAASFAFDPALDAVVKLGREIGLPVDARLAPYAQTLQQLLAPSSELRASRMRVVAARLKDLAGPAGSAADGAAELARALHAADDGAPTLVLLCPQSDGADDASVEALCKAFAGRPPTTVLDARLLFRDFGVHAPFDALADAAANIPYTEEAVAALAAGVVRWASLKTRAPIKLIAVDGDNTLWDGVLGEDGPHRLGLGPARRALQERLAAAAEGGQIVALLSKNDDRDVVSLFGARADFPLRLDHILARRVNWLSKADNLRELAEEFAVAHDSILFIDDNPVECAAMRSGLPGVFVVRAPDSEDPGFFDRLWLLDRPELTVADMKRIDSYRAEESRNRAKAEARTLRDFFASLELRIEIAPAVEKDIARIAQMTQRTNQFNATLKRLDERDVRLRLDRLGEIMRVVSVRDRFGDYGVVGCMAATAAGDALVADLFMLSCRALGRGVEHAMVRELADIAEGRGLKRLAFEYVEGPRNGPVRRFLSDLTKVELFGDGLAPVSCESARQFAFDPDSAAASVGAEAPPAARPAAEPGADLGAGYEKLAMLASGSALVAALRGEARARPDLVAGFLAPAPGLETQIALVWEEVLGVRPVGAHDPFRELGGRSIDAVRIHGLLARRFGIETELVDLFRFGTVSLLARHLGEAPAGRGGPLEERAAKMRVARQAFARRRDALKEEAS